MIANLSIILFDIFVLQTIKESVKSTTKKLGISATKLFSWFKNNHLEVNPGKSNFLFSTKKPEIVSFDGIRLTANSHEKLLRVTAGSELKFENHVTELCVKVSKKLESIYRILIQLSSLDMDALF